MTPAQFAELYMSTFVLQTTDDFSHSLDFTPLNTLLQQHISEMRAKDIFRIMQLHTQTRNKQRSLLPNHIRGIDESVVIWVQSNFQTLMPEEVVMVLKQNSSAMVVNKAAEYLNFQLDQMDLNEISSLFSAIMSRHNTVTESTPEFERKIMRLSEKMAEYFKQNLNRLDDKALAQLLQMHVKQHKGLPEDFMSPKVIRENVLRVLSQENFHTNNFVAIFKSTFELLTMPKFNPGVERRDLPVR